MKCSLQIYSYEVHGDFIKMQVIYNIPKATTQFNKGTFEIQ